MPDEPTAAAAPVVVTPILASQSRTLRLSRRGTICTLIVGFLPDLIEVVLRLLATDPHFAAQVASWFPLPVRIVAMATIVSLLEKYRRLRNDTSAPIIGTPAAQNLPTANEAKENAA